MISNIIQNSLKAPATISWFDSVSALSPHTWYRMSATSGVTETDIGSNTFNGTYFNTPSLNQGAVLNEPGDNSVTFIPTTSYLQGHSDSAATANSIYCFEVIFEVLRLPILNGVFINIFGPAQNTQRALISINTSGQLSYQSRNSLGSFLSTGTTSLNSGKHHAFMICDPVQNRQELWLDGVLEWQDLRAFTHTNIVNFPLIVGNWGGLSGAELKDAKISEAVYYNFSISTATIQANAAAALAQF